MKFDYIIGNPPYQKQVGKITTSIWDLMVVKFYSLLKNNAEMSLIHPSGWRFLGTSSKNSLKNVKKIYENNKIIDFKKYSYEDGNNTFGVSTDFDKITIQKTKQKNEFLKDLIIPTKDTHLYNRLKAKSENEKINIINGTSNIQESGKYKVIYGLPKKGAIIKYTDNFSDKYNAPKLIIARGGYITILDKNNEYYLSANTYAIIDTIENLKKIKKVIDSDKMKKFLGNVSGIEENRLIDPTRRKMKILKTLKKDFFKYI